MPSTARSILGPMALQRVILVSSCAVYGSAKAYTPTDESHPVRPDTIYAITKYAQEQIVHAFCTSRNMPSAIMRLGYVYGPDIHPSRAVAKLLQGVVEGQGLTLRNADSAGLHLIHTSDIARIGIGLLGSGSGVYNVVSPSVVDCEHRIEAVRRREGEPTLSATAHARRASLDRSAACWLRRDNSQVSR